MVCLLTREATAPVFGRSAFPVRIADLIDLDLVLEYTRIRQTKRPRTRQKHPFMQRFVAHVSIA